MFLEKLEIQGFKSFANKNLLVFPGMLEGTRRGITSIVGPNGSGKSNVADAVRWALGEQSMKTLRGKKSEDIIFSGSDKKGKLGMAEVSLFLNNESGQAPVDYSQIVITRRLYRNGDSEYMLNNNRVRLSDIQMLLAKAKFGQKTYSVIGQGMVEGFLNTTLAERKEFFDEATGVKQFQIKRDDSLNKLRSSYENLVQAQMLLTEIEPRLKSLTRQVNKLKKRDEIENELKELQLKYYRRLWHEINGQFSRFNNEYLELEKIKFEKDKKLEALNRRLADMETENTANEEYANLQDDLNDAQSKKEKINQQLAKVEAQLELKLEASGQVDLSYLISKKEELGREIESLKEEVDRLEESLAVNRSKEGEFNLEKDEINRKIDNLNEKINDLSQSEPQEEKQRFKSWVKAVLKKIKIIKEETELDRIKENLISIEAEIEKFINDKNTEPENGQKEANGKLNEAYGFLKKLTQDKETLVGKINDNNLRITARFERVKLLEEKINGLKEEILALSEKINTKSKGADYNNFNKEQIRLKKDQEIAREKIDKIRTRIAVFAKEEEEKKSQLFALQKETQVLQVEVNELNNQLNSIKINSTRFETKLESLEIEIREELKSLKAIKSTASDDDFDKNNLKEKITQLKRQLEMIGGIDPEVEKEYNETKERFDFLDSQVSDFSKAVSSFEKIIKELDAIIKERFDKEFSVIEKNFSKYFKILFNGGNAKIFKVKEEMKEEKADNTEGEEDADVKKKNELGLVDVKKIKFLQKHNATGLAGVEIQAVPPGKKIKTVTMLSGGERALTAIALICAIINSNPAPFVVLDEVDAALDEANSERLAKILDELSHRTQFIVITHNRASMRRANILYGVTMGDDGVSKLLSVKLDEADGMVR